MDKEGYIYRIERGDVATRVRIGTGDLTIIKIYKELYKKPITTIVHEMIGIAAKCWEEKHDEKVRELEELRIKLLAAEHIMALYREKYGQLHVKKGVRDPIVKPQEESLDKPGS